MSRLLAWAGAPWQRLRDLTGRLVSERLEPGRAASAVFVGVTVAIVPIYGLQSVVALALATALGLNRPLTLAATFVNNPILQPFLVMGSLQIGHLVLTGTFLALSLDALSAVSISDHLLALFVGGLLLSVPVGGVAATMAYVAAVSLSGTSRPTGVTREAWHGWVGGRFRDVGGLDRGFVRWKIRLDRIFARLLADDLGEGPAVDLGCGHGITLALVAFRDPMRELHGCDVDAGRVDVAERALRGLNARLAVADARTFDLPEAGLVLIMDVLQYLTAHEQESLLGRCGQALSAGGLLVFRVPDPERGVLAWLTRAFDRAIFLCQGVRRAPTRLPLSAYRRILEAGGLTVEGVRRERNVLPLAHLTVRARKVGGAR